jgi:hypothetical protein
MGAHVDVEGAVGVDVAPDQGGERFAVAVGEPLRPFGLGEDLLEDERVDEHERGLQEVHGEHRDLEVVAVVAGEFVVLAVVDEVDAAVPGLHDLPGFVNLAADGFAREEVAEVDGAADASELVERLVGWVFGPPRMNRRRSCWASAVPSLSAVAYLTSSS